MDSVTFVYAVIGQPNKEGKIFTKEALLELQNELSKSRKMQLKDQKGPYEARVFQCYIQDNSLMIQVEVR